MPDPLYSKLAPAPLPAADAAAPGELPVPGPGWRLAARSGLAWVKLALADFAALARAAARRDRAVLLAMLGVDLALMACFIAYAYAEHYGLTASPFYGHLEFSFVDRGYPETFGYAKQLLTVLLLVRAHADTRQPVYRALAVLFGIALMDDSIGLHEAIGDLLTVTPGLPVAGAELAAWSLIGVAPLVAVVAGYLRSAPSARAHARALGVAFVVLAFFAVGMDIVHGFVRHRVHGFETVLTLFEDGGELVSMTLLALLALGVSSVTAAAANDASTAPTLRL